MDIDNMMTNSAKVSELNQEIVRLQHTNMSLQAELDTVKFMNVEQKAQLKEQNYKSM